MNLTEPLALVSAGVYLIALLLAVARRKTFPLVETLTVMLIVGVGFTALVAFLVPLPTSLPTQTSVPPGQLIFVLIYLLFFALLLIPGVPPWSPPGWKDPYLKHKLFTMIYKLVISVVIPLVGLRLFWSAGWASLGFSKGDLPNQLLSAGLLILLLGGFNFLVGGAAAPLRKRQFSLGVSLGGLGIAFLWNLLETGLVEEFFFRAFLQARLVSFFDSPAGGILAASLLFGVAHAPGIYLRKGGKESPLGENPALLDTLLYAVLALGSTGWFTGLLYWRTQSLLAPVLVHAAIDAVAHAAEFIKGLGLAKSVSPSQEGAN